MSLRLGGVGEGPTAVCGCEVGITKRLLLHRVTVGEPDIICCLLPFRECSFKRHQTMSDCEAEIELRGYVTQSDVIP